MRTPVFELHILPMFRLIDREHMLFVFDLFDYDQVVAHADGILARVAETRDMPPVGSSGPWPDEWCALFKRWIDAGFKRLELGTADTFTWAESGNTASFRVNGTYPRTDYDGWLSLEEVSESTRLYALVMEAPDAESTAPGIPFQLRERYRFTQPHTVFLRDATGVRQVH